VARFVDFQTNFVTGELDPLLRARVDLQQYNNALAKATNVVIQPQGGLRRRPGLKHIIELPNSGTESAANGVRLINFEFSVDDSYMLCFVATRMFVIKDGVLITNINGTGNNFLTTSITAAMLDDLCWVQSADTMVIVHPDLSPVKLVRGGTDASWTISTITFDSIPLYAFALTVSNPAADITPSAVSGNVTITASAGVFSAGNVNQYINSSPQGRAKIVEFVSTTEVKAVTEYPFFSTALIASGNWELEAGYESVWSATKGYPRSVTFHEGRLYFGGSKSRPSTIWGSKVGLFFDFSATELLDDDAVEATLDTSQLNVIVDMLSGRDLQVFTTGGEFFVPQAGTDPITPLTLTFKNVSKNGTKPGTRVETIETGTIFVQRQGKALNEFLFSDTQLTYVTSRISLLSGHLLKGPKRIALRRATSTDEGDLLLVVNATDGTLAVFSVMRSQQVVAPSEYTTDGTFVDVQTDVNDIYCATKRTFNGTDRYFVELFQDARFTDCAFIGGAAASASSLPHEGKALNVICDGVPQSNETVSSGSVTFDRASTASYEVGLPFTVFAKTMPAEIQLQSGTRVSFKKRVVQVNAIVNDSQHLNINNQPVPFRNFDNPLLDLPIQEFTGVKRLDGIRGYDREAAIEVTQTLPLKMTLLGLEYKIAVHQGT
jgi:hypothetical protein